MQDMDLCRHSNHNIAFSEKRKVKIGTLFYVKFDRNSEGREGTPLGGVNLLVIIILYIFIFLKIYKSYIIVLKIMLNNL